MCKSRKILAKYRKDQDLVRSKLAAVKLGVDKVESPLLTKTIFKLGAQY